MMLYHGGGTPPGMAAWGLSWLGEEALHPNPSCVPAPCREGGCAHCAPAGCQIQLPARTPTHTSASTHPTRGWCFLHLPHGGGPIPGYLRPAVPAVALSPLPCDEEAGLPSGKAPEQLQVRDEVQDIVVASQLGPLGTCLHGHRPATPALRQPPANSGVLGTGTSCQQHPSSVGTPCSRAGHPSSKLLGSPKMAPGRCCAPRSPHWVGECGSSRYLCFRTSPARSSPVLQEWTGQENWSPGERWGSHQSPPARANGRVVKWDQSSLPPRPQPRAAPHR